ncbi:hypothetical protein V6N13_148381 [Hibiscus sabdariffa]|uniref:Uncharacterized protein n=1 Tax=Hibiscus sabdariffa TaxID=183260 RepID=A0ABR2TYG3_9ROSI
MLLFKRSYGLRQVYLGRNRWRLGVPSWVIWVEEKHIASKEKVVLAPSILRADNGTTIRVVDKVDSCALKEVNGRSMHGLIRVWIANSANRNITTTTRLPCKGLKSKKKNDMKTSQPTLTE